MRTGAAWDALAIGALVVPFAAFVPVARRVAPWVSFGGWFALLLAGAAPSVGSFTPDPLALAAGAGAALAAATGPAVPIPAVVAAVVGLVAGLADPGGGSGVVVLAAVAAAGLGLLLGTDEGRASFAAVLLPLAVLGPLRAGPVPTGVSVAVAVVAVAVAAAVVGGRIPAAGALGPLAVAVAASPIDVAAPAAALLGAAALLAVASRSPWGLVAAVPGAALVARSLADVPAVDADVVTMFAVAAALAAVATALSTTPVPDPDRVPGAAPVALALVAWLVVVPGSWRWAVPDPAVLAGWDRAAAVALAAGLAGFALRAAASLRPDREPAAGPR